MGAALTALSRSGGSSYNYETGDAAGGGGAAAAGSGVRYITPMHIAQVGGGARYGGGGGDFLYADAPARAPPPLVQEGRAVSRAGFVLARSVRLLPADDGSARLRVACELDLFCARTEVRVYWGAVLAGRAAREEPLWRRLLVRDAARAGAARAFLPAGRAQRFAQAGYEDALDAAAADADALGWAPDWGGRRAPRPAGVHALTCPLVIALTAVDDAGAPARPVRSHLTVCRLERRAGAPAGWAPVVVEQIEQIDDVVGNVRVFFGTQADAAEEGQGDGPGGEGAGGEGPGGPNAGAAPEPAAAAAAAAAARASLLDAACVICLDEPRTTAVLPCRHLCLCAPCAQQLVFHSSKCPVCRGTAQSLLAISGVALGEAPAAQR
jgi:hypothetical protein